MAERAQAPRLGGWPPHANQPVRDDRLIHTMLKKKVATTTPDSPRARGNVARHVGYSRTAKRQAFPPPLRDSSSSTRTGRPIAFSNM